MQKLYLPSYNSLVLDELWLNVYILTRTVNFKLASKLSMAQKLQTEAESFKTYHGTDILMNYYLLFLSLNTYNVNNC